MKVLNEMMHWWYHRVTYRGLSGHQRRCTRNKPNWDIRQEKEKQHRLQKTLVLYVLYFFMSGKFSRYINTETSEMQVWCWVDYVRKNGQRPKCVDEALHGSCMAHAGSMAALTCQQGHQTQKLMSLLMCLCVSIVRSEVRMDGCAYKNV